MATATAVAQVSLLPRLSVLVGIAAGLKSGPLPGKKSRNISGLAIGTVVIPREIIDYSYAVVKSLDELVEELPLHRKLPVKRLGSAIPRTLQGPDLVAFQSRRDKVMEGINQNWNTGNILKSFPTPTNRTETDWRKFLDEFVVPLGEPAFSDNDLASSNLLLRNESVLRRLANRHVRVRAADMESAGFAAASEACGGEWFVVRGISDLGDDEKSDMFQQYAAVSAAAHLWAILHRLDASLLHTSVADSLHSQLFGSATAAMRIVLNTFVTTFQDQLGTPVNLEVYWTGEAVIRQGGAMTRIPGVIRDGEMKAERAGYLNRFEPRRFFPFLPQSGNPRAVAQAGNPESNLSEVFHVIGIEERTPLKWVYAVPLFSTMDHGAGAVRTGVLCCSGVNPLVGPEASPEDQQMAAVRLKAMVGSIRDLVTSTSLITGLFELVPREVVLESEP